MKALNWTPNEIENLPINALLRVFDIGELDPLLINNGRVVGCEKTETPGAATPRESR